MKQLNRYNYLHFVAFILTFLLDFLYRQFRWMKYGYSSAAASSSMMMMSWLFHPRDFRSYKSLLTPRTFTSMMMVDATLLFQGIFSIVQMMPSYRSSVLVQKRGIGGWYILSATCQALNVLGFTNVFDATFSTLLAGCHLFCLSRILKNQHKIALSPTLPSSISKKRIKKVLVCTCDDNCAASVSPNTTGGLIVGRVHEPRKGRNHTNGDDTGMNREDAATRDTSACVSIEEYWLLRFPFALASSWAGFIFLWSVNTWFVTLLRTKMTSGQIDVVQVILFSGSVGIMMGTSAKLLFYNGDCPFYPTAYVFSWTMFGIAGNLYGSFDNDYSWWFIITLQTLSVIVGLILFISGTYASWKSAKRSQSRGHFNDSTYMYRNQHEFYVDDDDGDPTSTTDDSDASYEGGRMMSLVDINEEGTIATRTEI